MNIQFLPEKKSYKPHSATPNYVYFQICWSSFLEFFLFDKTSRLFYTSQCVAFELMFLKQFFSQGETKLQCNNSHTSSVIKLRKPCYYMMYAPKFKKKRGWNRTPNDVFLLLVQSFLRLSELSLWILWNDILWYEWASYYINDE